MYLEIKKLLADCYWKRNNCCAHSWIKRHKKGSFFLFSFLLTEFYSEDNWFVAVYRFNRINLLPTPFCPFFLSSLASFTLTSASVARVNFIVSLKELVRVSTIWHPTTVAIISFAPSLCDLSFRNPRRDARRVIILDLREEKSTHLRVIARQFETTFRDLIRETRLH